jgi:hypothetical protein
MTQNQNQPIEQAEKSPTIPPLPPWPTSRPGPMITQPPAGQKRLHVRTDQLVEVDYSQELGKSSIRSEGK